MGTGCRECFHGCAACDAAAELDALIESRAEALLVERGLAETRPGTYSTAEVIDGWRAEWNRAEVSTEDRGEADAYESSLDRLDAAMGAL
jgi:hypothetical protein